MQILVLGKGAYMHHDGHEADGDWAAKIVLTRIGGEAKFLEVNIIMVSEPVLFLRETAAAAVEIRVLTRY